MYRLTCPVSRFAIGVFAACIQACAMSPDTVKVKEVTAATTTASNQPIRAH